MANQPINVAIIGFDGSQQASMELFLSRKVGEYELVPAEYADAIIFNGDQPQDPAKLQQQYQEDYGKPGVLVSIQPLRWPLMVTLQKPYTTDSLSAVLKELAGQMSMGSTSPCDNRDHSEAYLRQVLEDYRASVRRGQGLDDSVDEAKQQHDSQLKAFQKGLFERKRRAEELAGTTTQQESSASSWGDLLAYEQQQQKPTADLDADIVSMTQQVIAEQDPIMQLESHGQLQASGVPLLLDPTVQDVQDCCGNLVDFNLRDRSQRRNLFFNPEGQLFRMVLEARKRGQRDGHPVAIVGLPNQYLVYQPEGDLFLTSVDYDVLMQMAQVRFRFGELQLQSQADTEKVDDLKDAFQHRAQTLLWKLACYSAKGRLMEGISLENPYQLSAQLPSDVILDLPRTSAIIKQWQQEPMSVIDLMNRLHVEQRFVFPFMTAAFSLGLLQ